MNVYRITVKYIDRHMHPYRVTKLYVGDCFNDMIAFARSHRNPWIPEKATRAGVESAELIDGVTMAGENTFTSYESLAPPPFESDANDFKTFCRDLGEWAKTRS